MYHLRETIISKIKFTNRNDTKKITHNPHIQSALKKSLVEQGNAWPKTDTNPPIIILGQGCQEKTLDVSMLWPTPL